MVPKMPTLLSSEPMNMLHSAANRNNCCRWKSGTDFEKEIIMDYGVDPI